VTLLAFLLFVVAVVVMVLVHRHTQRQLVERMDASLLARQKSIEKQGRALIREHERTRRMAAKVVDDSKGLQRQIQQVLTDPKVQRVLNDG
jgi:hypothetical protein